MSDLTHEQDCPAFGKNYVAVCHCKSIRAAYQRGLERGAEHSQQAHNSGWSDGYKRGREDAAKAVYDALARKYRDVADTHPVYEVVAAARGESIHE